MIKYNKEYGGIKPMMRKGYFTEFYLQVDKQARAMYDAHCVGKNGEFVTGTPINSWSYQDKNERLLQEYNDCNNSLISIKEYFSKGYPYWEKEKTYVCRAFNRYLSDKFDMSDDEIKNYFAGKDVAQVSREYYEHFRTFFIRQTLLTMGDTLSREHLENRVRRARLELSKLSSSGEVMFEFQRSRERLVEMYQTALAYMQHAQIGNIDLFALFNAHASTVYVPQGKTLDPKDKLVEVFPIDKSFKLEEDVVSREG